VASAGLLDLLLYRHLGTRWSFNERARPDIDADPDARFRRAAPLALGRDQLRSDVAVVAPLASAIRLASIVTTANKASAIGVDV
jgi:hypothetical protein